MLDMVGLPTWTIHNLKGSEVVNAAGLVPVRRPPCRSHELVQDERERHKDLSSCLSLRKTVEEADGRTSNGSHGSKGGQGCKRSFNLGLE